MATINETKYDAMVANAAANVKISSTKFKDFIGDVKGVVDANSPEGQYAADAGTTDAYVVTLDPAPSAYVAGMVVRFAANTANTGACTLNVNSLGVKTIKKNTSDDMETGDIAADQIIEVAYDGTNFQFTGAATGEIAAHKAEKVTDSGGVHGLTIESGTFSPTIRGVSTSGTNTYSTQSGNYYRIGKLVFIDIKIIINVKDTNMAGPIVVSSLPFPCKYLSALSIGHIEKVGTDGKFLSTRFSADGSSELFIYKANTETTASVVSSSDIADGSRIYISGSYAIN